jgi:hypothetical protein
MAIPQQKAKNKHMKQKGQRYRKEFGLDPYSKLSIYAIIPFLNIIHIPVFI